MAKSFAPGSTLLTTFSKRLRSQMTSPQSGATRILNKRAISTTAAVGGAGSMLTSPTSTRVVAARQGPSRSQAQTGTAASTKIGRQCTARRGFTSSSKVGYKTVEEQRSRYRSGVSHPHHLFLMPSRDRWPRQTQLQWTSFFTSSPC
jgi:hypothetical protein